MRNQSAFEQSSRRKALFITVAFHILIIGGVFAMSSDYGTMIKEKMTEWISNITGEESDVVEIRP